MSNIFRNEVIEAKKHQWMGEIVVAYPLSVTLCAAVSTLIAIFLIFFLFLGEYTRREHVTGRVVSTQGVAKIYSPASGVVTKKFVSDGDSVKKGQILYLVSSERNTTKGSTQVAVGEEILLKRKHLLEELELKRQVSHEDILALQRKTSGLEKQIQGLKQEISTQEKSLALSELTLEKYRELFNSKFVSQAQVVEHEKERLDQQARLQALQRTLLSVEVDLSAARSELQNSPLNEKSQISTIERNIAEIEQENYQNEAQREIAVVASQDGRVTTVLSEPGQPVAINAPMLSLLPITDQFKVYLYVPSRSIGFLKNKAEVQMRYEAFPYQKFGFSTGKIKEISRSPLSPEELNLLKGPTEDLYRVTVALDNQYVLAYGEKISLQHGMQLDADILLDTRRLYEWLLEPLYSISGKI